MVELTPEKQQKLQELKREMKKAKSKLNKKEKTSARASTEIVNSIEVKVTQNSDTRKRGPKLKTLLLNSQAKRSS